MFRAVQRDLIDDGLGVYLIHDLRGVLYVGRSNDLRRRFDEHRLKPSNPYLAEAIRKPFGEMRFSWITTSNDRMTGKLERELSRWLQPPCNRLTPSITH
ncbi:MAG: GIY-YIG nuclease family protein [Shimia sp.]